MFITIKKWTVLYFFSLFILFFGFLVIFKQGESVQTIAVQQITSPILILDPGHGGIDGGAVAQDGTVESHVNLSIAKKAASIAETTGWSVYMTREEDMSIHDSSAKTIRQQKVSDLKNRTALCNTVPNGILISIHQNSLPSNKSVRGAQVFYNDNPGSQELAQTIQDYLNKVINEINPKSIKPIGDSSYLMSNVECPAVLIECAFLSNFEDTELIKSEDYQMKLAAVIISATEFHLNNSTK